MNNVVEIPVDLIEVVLSDQSIEVDETPAEAGKGIFDLGGAIIEIRDSFPNMIFDPHAEHNDGDDFEAKLIDSIESSSLHFEQQAEHFRRWQRELRRSKRSQGMMQVKFLSDVEHENRLSFLFQGRHLHRHLIHYSHHIFCQFKSFFQKLAIIVSLMKI